MRCRVFALALCFLPATNGYSQTPQTSVGQQAHEDTCTVSGMVVRRTDSAPLKSAVVQLIGEDHDHTIATKTTLDGRFALKNVPAGQYRLTVTRNGYFRAEYGQKKPSDPGATFSLKPGQVMSDLLFRLGRAGVITGRVYDPDGEPMPNAIVEAQRMVYDKGHRELRTETQSESNDLGEFRLHGLSPGRYYVSAQSPNWEHVVGDRQFSGEGKGTEKGYTKMYYPNATDPGRASVIVVKEGEEITSIDFLMKEVSVYRIRGKVINTTSKGSLDRAWVAVLPRSQRNSWVTLGGPNEVKKDGSFEIPEIPAGAYTLLASLFAEGKSYGTQQDVDVSTADVDGVMLTVGPGLTISGRILWDGKPSYSTEILGVNLKSSERIEFWNGNGSRIAENNQFTLEDVSDGVFNVEVSGLSKDCYIKEVRYGDSALPDTEIRVSKGASGDLDITVSSRGARIEGTVVTGENLSASGFWVVAVPEESKRNFERLYKADRTDQNGSFSIRGLAPGKYELFSWDSIEKGAWEDPDFLKEFDGQGESLVVEDGDVKRADLKLLQAKETSAKTE